MPTTLLKNPVSVNATSTAVSFSVSGTAAAATSGAGAQPANTLTVEGTTGQDTTGTGQAAGAGANVSITAGNGGAAPSGSTTGAGGSVAINPGAPGGGAGTAAAYGNVLMATAGGNVGVGTTPSQARLQLRASGATSATKSFVVENASGVDLFGIRDDGAGAIGSASVSLTANTPYSNLFFGGDFSGTQIITNNSGNAITAVVAGVANEIRFAGSQDFSAAFGGNFVAASVNSHPSSIVTGVQGSATIQSLNGRAHTLAGGILKATTNDASGGTFINVTGASVNAAVGSAGTTVTNLYGLQITDFNIAGTATNTYGLYIGDVTGGTQTNPAYSLYSADANAKSCFAGNLGVGTTAPTSKLHVNGGVQVGAPTGGDKGAGSINVAGDIYRNGSPVLEKLEEAYRTIADLTARVERLEKGISARGKKQENS